jgi:hypothetical protein
MEPAKDTKEVDNTVKKVNDFPVPSRDVNS